MSGLLHIALALSGFLLVAAIQRSPLPWPGGAGVADKWQYFEEHADQYDTVMIGSSRLYRSFIPREMRAVWEEKHLLHKVFNLAAPGLGRFETNFLAHRLLAMKPKHLKTLVIELWRWDPNEMKRNENTPRAVYWHSGEQTWNAIGSCWTYPGLNAKKRLKLSFSHLNHFALKLASYGLGPQILNELSTDRTLANPAQIRRDHGYRALEDEPFGSIRERRDLFLAESGRFESAMLDRHETVRAEDPALQLHRGALERTVRLARSAGVEVIFVVPPGPWAPPTDLGLDVDPASPVIAYSDRAQFPYLYEEAGRFDRFHVTASVAKKLSRDFARALLPYLSERN